MIMQCATIVHTAGMAPLSTLGLVWTDGLGLCGLEAVVGCADDGLHVDVEERCLESVSMVVVVVISITQYRVVLEIE
jgi:hypothetical protein